jgi:hypothetical protein
VSIEIVRGETVLVGNVAHFAAAIPKVGAVLRADVCVSQFFSTRIRLGFAENLPPDAIIFVRPYQPNPHRGRVAQLAEQLTLNQ